jgi:hypothetical protein
MAQHRVLNILTIAAYVVGQFPVGRLVRIHRLVEGAGVRCPMCKSNPCIRILWSGHSRADAHLGVRTSEAVGIAWDRLDLSGGVLLVCQSNWHGKRLTVKSKASVRDLPLPPVPVDMRNDFRLRWRPNAFGLLFAYALLLLFVPSRPLKFPNVPSGSLKYPRMP